MDRRPLRALAGLLIGVVATAARAEGPSVDAPAGARLVLEAGAQGVQIYNCAKSGDLYRWTFSAPEAALFDAAGRQIGTHFAGPGWQLQDGSRIVGAAVAQAPAPEPGAIPWVLLRVAAHDGAGGLSEVGLVRRIDTHGGTAPTDACDASHAGTQARMRYTARYLFYAAPP
jgi:hypothetical protein